MARPLLALLLVAILLLAGCTGAQRRAGPSDGAGGGARVQPIVVGTTDTITSLDPGNAYEFLSTNVLWNTMGNLLTYRLDSPGVQPDLARSMPEVSADGLTYTFRLRDNARYADGTPVRAKDFLWALDRNSGRVGGQEGGPAFLIYDSPGVDVANSSAPDDTTLVLRLRQPGVFFQSLVVFPNFAPLPQAIYSKRAWVEPTGPTDNLPVSSGPYRIAEYRANEFLRLEKNPHYAGPRAAQHDAILVRFYASSASLKAAVENSEVDVAYRTFSPGDWGDLEQRQRGFRTMEVPAPSPIRFLAFNVEQPKVQDARVRQALAMLVDRDEVARVVFQGTVQPAYSIVPSGVGFAGQKESFRERYGAQPDVEGAKALLRQAGYSTTNKLRLDLWFNSDNHYGDTEDELATLLRAQWERSGVVQAALQSKQWVAYKEDFRNGLYEAFLIGWFPDYMDVDNYLSPFMTPGGARAFGTFYDNPQALQLVKAQQAERDPGARAAVVEQLQDIAARDAFMVPLFTGTMQATARSSVQGLTLPPNQLLPYFTLRV